MKDFTYKDIVSVSELFELSDFRIKRALGYREVQEISKLALNKTIRSEAEAVKHLKKYFQDDSIAESPEPECLCGPANGLRWEQPVVTWAYNAYNQDIPNTVRLIRENWKAIQAVCGIRFGEGRYRDEVNIVISNEVLDGRGGTLGVAYQPSSGDRMSACGPMCGNVIIDKSEMWTPEFLKTVLLHEQLHALGLSHSSNRNSIMYSRYAGPRELDPETINELLQRYPLKSSQNVEIYLG